jgi:hypothetical protein
MVIVSMTFEVMAFPFSSLQTVGVARGAAMISTAAATRNSAAPRLSPAAARRVMGVFILYTVFFALLPQIARIYPFELMFFGGDRPVALEAELTDRYLNFAYALIGAIMTGWFVTLWAAMKEETRTIWNAGLMGLAVWYVLDSGASVLWGFPLNVLTNTGFLIVLGGTLLASRTAAA